ncbi:galactose mutarotase [Weissella diestrammenae]|uniref:Maltose epimerase n=1 Tax=Weissella diestrammenae TaxID=1162633 RepID=A0A7G9T6D6_9LACO|nr:aldose epimerase family protein [Weissella diestrammenae]MCM0583292.1 galactose mutarotase [Weissella diestrammenae]QNN75661.1 galactose mutarotase [Weissella diestrammenae]
MTIQVTDFGQTPDGQQVKRVVIENANGHQLSLVSWGASWQSFVTAQGVSLVLGFDDLDGYLHNGYFLGNAVGRVAGRIDAAEFELNGKRYQLDANEGQNNLHGGEHSFSHRNWDIAYVDEAGNSVTFATTMTEAQDNFPGTMGTTVTYTLTDDNEVRLIFGATSDQDTLYNPTSHVYFNMQGVGTDARQLELMLQAPKHLAFRPDKIPTGELLSVAETAFDFQTATKIGDNIDRLPSDAFDKKFDDAFALSYEPGTPAAILTDPQSKRSVEMTTDRNAVIFFITNPAVDDYEDQAAFLAAHPYNGVALEAQTLSDAIHHPSFGDIVLPANQHQEYVTTYAFKNI